MIVIVNSDTFFVSFLSFGQLIRFGFSAETVSVFPGIMVIRFWELLY